MFRDTNAFSGFSVDDLGAAMEFYRDHLGLAVTEEYGSLVIRLGGGGKVFIYAKEDHAPATFTILNFPVDDIVEATEMLAAKGVEFERYEGFPHDDRGIVRGQGPAIAWFLDPAGNVLSVIEASV